MYAGATRVVLMATVALSFLPAARPAYAEDPIVPACAVWRACGTWDNWSEGGYTLYNNIWGDGAGPQCIWACDHSNWGVWADHPDTSGVKSYPNSEFLVGATISSMKTLTSDFSSTVPTSGSFATTYDIWSGRKIEVMLWMNKRGNHEPWAARYGADGKPIPDAANVACGGHTWNFYYNGGPRGFHVYSMVRTTNTYAATVDILSCLNWLKANSNIGDVRIDNVQLGFEISGSPGGSNFTMNSYNVSFGSAGTSAPAAPSGLTAKVASATAVDLAWTDNSNNEERFEIERSFSSGSGFVPIASVGANVKTLSRQRPVDRHQILLPRAGR